MDIQFNVIVVFFYCLRNLIDFPDEVVFNRKKYCFASVRKYFSFIILKMSFNFITEV